MSCCKSTSEDDRERFDSLAMERSPSTDATSGLRRRAGNSSLSDALRRGSLLRQDAESPVGVSSVSSTGNLTASPSPKVSGMRKKSSLPNIIEAAAANASPSSRKNSSQKDIKILLLGTGESGKSTIVKQMRILHKGGFTKDERLAFRMDIYCNVVEGMQQIMRAISELQIDYGSEETEGKTELYSQYLQDLEEPEYEEWSGIPYNLHQALSYLWLDSGIQKIYSQLIHMSYIIDSAPYFLDELERVASPDYIPTDADIVRARTTTTGVADVQFQSRYFNIKMVDVGGQRTERDKKWVQCFENVTCVIFCVSLAEYDQVLLEHTDTNRMLESFKLFEDVVNSQWFLNSSVVLFLNKTDLFCKKLSNIPLSEYFEDFGGDDQSFEQAAEFLRDKFLSLNQYRLQIYPYLTCATDTENINMVFQAVEETVLANALKDTGIF